MWSSFLVFVEISFVCLIMYGLFVFYKKFVKSEGKQDIIKVIKKVPIDYKSSAKIIKVLGEYYLCVDNSGIVQIKYDPILDVENHTIEFQKAIAAQMEKLKNIDISKITESYNRNKIKKE